MFTTLIVLAGGFFVLMILAVVALPKKKPSAAGSETVFPQAYLPMREQVEPVRDNRTFRQRQIDEDAAQLSAEFAAYEEDRYRAEIRSRAAKAFAQAQSAKLGTTTNANAATA